MDNFCVTWNFSVPNSVTVTVAQHSMLALAKESCLPVVNWFAARNQDGVLSYREWTTFALPGTSRYPRA